MGVYKNYVIKNARIWNGEEFIYGDLAVSGNRVFAIGSSFDFASDAVIDGEGKLLTPGLIDVHTHLKNISCDKYGADVSLCTVPFGVTCAVDGGASKGDSAYLDTLSIKSAVFVEVKIRDNKSCLESVEAMREKYGEYFAGLKVYFDTLDPHVKDISALEGVCEYAEKHGYRVMVHSTGTPAPMTEIVRLLKKGDILTHAYHGGKNTSELNDFEAIFAAKEKGIVIDVGMACGVHTDFDILRKAIRIGAGPDTIGTDITRLSAYIRGGRYGLTACMSVCRHLGMSESDILRAVTVAPANAVGRPCWGRLTVGGDASFALLDTDCPERFFATDKAGHTVDFNGTFKCVLTAVNGEIIYTA